MKLLDKNCEKQKYDPKYARYTEKYEVNFKLQYYDNLIKEHWVGARINKTGLQPVSRTCGATSFGF